ncbi:NYN domain-containing protein, partial [Candidatus Shapirobacteria bacterium]|nr:NYN domain-containing protein [Candidatus Shapirobacteria bacterium]
MKFKIKSKSIAFIDAANIIYGAKRESGFKVDLRKLAKYLRSRFQALEIYFYGGVNTKKIDFTKYREMLKGFGLIPRLKETK